MHNLALTPRRYQLPVVGNLLLGPRVDNGWSASGGTLTPRGAANPNGLCEGGRLVESSAAASAHQVAQTVTKAASAIAYRLSCYGRQIGGSNRGFSLFVFDSDFSGGAWGGVNLRTGATSKVPGSFGVYATPTFVSKFLGNGWYYAEIAFTSGANTGLICAPSMDDGVGNDSYDGDGFSAVALWGAWLRPQ